MRFSPTVSVALRALTAIGQNVPRATSRIYERSPFPTTFETLS